MRAAIYVRVSTLSQLDGCSIEIQKQSAIKYCEAKGYTIYNIYSDNGASASNTNREGLRRLINDINNFDIVLVYKLDRLSRSQKDTLNLIEDVFYKNKVGFISITESLDTNTALGKATIGMLSVFAQLEREMIRERILMGKIARAEKGKPMAWSPNFIPFGYDYVGNRYVINEDSEIVRSIFEMYLNGNGIKTIARSLSSKNKKWYHSTIKIILTNPVYIGKVRYKGVIYDGLHAPVIPEKTFKKVQNIIKKEAR